MRKGVVKVLGAIGLIIAAYGLYSSILLSSKIWYSFFVIGGTMLLASINYLLKKDSILRTFEKDWMKALRIYIIYVFCAIAIELVGRVMLNLWFYPSFNNADRVIHVFAIGYPFAFFFIKESFVLLKSKISSFFLVFASVTIINAFLHEIPNLFSYEWVYTISFVNFEILGINIVVIIGWTILIAVPLFVDKYLD